MILTYMMGHIDYYFKKESVTMVYNKQCICFHSFYQTEKAAFREFSRRLEKNRPQDVAKVLTMAYRGKIKSQAGNPGSIIL